MKLREKALSAAYIVAVAVAALLLTALLEFPHGPEHWSADLRTAYLSMRPASQRKDLALIYVTDKTLDRFPYTSPTDRSFLADLVRTIDAAGAKVIGLDFILDRPTEPAKDDELLAAIRNAKAKVMLAAIGTPTHADSKEARFEADFIARSKRPAGHIYFGEHHSALVVSDHVVRTTYERGDLGKPSFAAAVAREAGAAFEPGSHYISWLRPPKDGTEIFLTLTAENVLGEGDSPSTLPLGDLLKDRIVLIGGDFFDRDQHLTPFSVVSNHRYPGLFVHAQIIAQFLDNRSLTALRWPWKLLLIAIAVAFGFWAGLKSGGKYLFVELATVAGLILIGIFAFAFGGLIFPYTGTLLAWLGGAAGGHYGRRHHI